MSTNAEEILQAFNELEKERSKRALLEKELAETVRQRDALWQLIDDIDTLDDQARSNNVFFRTKAREIQKKRWVIHNPEAVSAPEKSVELPLIVTHGKPTIVHYTADSFVLVERINYPTIVRLESVIWGMVRNITSRPLPWLLSPGDVLRLEFVEEPQDDSPQSTDGETEKLEIELVLRSALP
jgi:hypothetical protein